MTDERLLRAKECINFDVRRAARVIARHYDDALRPVELKITQFNMMVPLAIAGRMTITALGDRLGMERSGVARNASALERRGLLSVHPGEDRRTRIVALTTKGRRLLTRALPLWEHAQTGLLERMTPKQQAGLRDGLSAALDAAREE